MWKGELIDLGEGRCLFFSPHSKKIVLFIAGLGDGFFTVPYTEYLPSLLQEAGWGFAQPIIRSSYNNYGRFTLQDEVEDLKSAISYLITVKGVQEIILMGHSTGCQDILQYLMTNENFAYISKIILQGGVSDRESPLAPTLILTENDEFLVPGYSSIFTKSRFQSLFGKGGFEDMFSSDLPDYPHLRSLRLPCLLLYSRDDEYVPDYVDKRDLLARWSKLNTSIQCYLVPGTHFLPDKSLFMLNCWPLIRKFLL